MKTRQRRKKHDIELLKLQLYDPATGLPNRAYLCQHMQKLINNNLTFALLSVSISNFKEINDKYGCEAGNMLPLLFLERLKKYLEKNLLVEWGANSLLL